MEATAQTSGVALTGKVRACDGYAVSKDLRHLNPSKTDSSTDKLCRGFVKLSGPNEVAALDGERTMGFCVTTCAGLCRFSFSFIRTIFPWVMERFLADMRTDGVPEVIRSDAEGEFQSQSVGPCDRHRIKWDFTTPDTPDHQRACGAWSGDA